jgi:tetratricopeptide (TPR) repeat protein
MTEERYLALQTKEVVGREKELAAMDWALDGDGNGQTRAVLFNGPGGIGKTRLLIEAVEQAHQRGLLSSGIVDLYHSDTHSNSGLEAAIIRAVDPNEAHFENYRALRAEFEHLRQEFVGAARLERLREALTNAFAEDFNALSRTQRGLLAFDTAELIQFESDVVQRICQVKEGAVEVREWLTAVIPRLQNTAVLLAGRGPRDTRDPRKKLWDGFRAAFDEAKGKRFAWQEYPLDRFTEAESLKYLSGVASAAREAEQERSAEGRREEADSFRHAADTIEHVRETVGRTIHHATEGRPVRLGLVIDLAVRGNIEDLFVPGDENDCPSEEMWAEIAPRLVEAIQELDLRYPVQDTLRYLAVARQGLDAELLHRLEPGWSLETCQERLESMAPLSFIKTRPGTELVFLHDEMYDILEQYLVQPSREAFVGNYKRIAEYYEHQLSEQVDGSEKENLEVNQLHYRLRENPQRGYRQYYAGMSESAIKGHKVGFDMRLRDEVLRFFGESENQRLAGLQGLTRDEIDRDCAVRWVNRHVAQGRYQRAVEVAETVLFFGPEPYHSTPSQPPAVAESLSPDLQQEARHLFGVDDPFFWGRLLTYCGEALLYHGAEAQAFPVLGRAVGLLRALEAEDGYRRWWQVRVLGRAYNRLGYAYRLARRYRLALDYNRVALHHYRQLDIREEMAETLNNAAFIYALLGDISTAEMWIDDALALRRALRQGYPLALSLNTRGLIHLLAGEPNKALPRCQEALRICRELEDWRGQGLAQNALGRIYCALGNLSRQGVYDFDQAVGFYQQAEDAFTQAVPIFGDRGKAPERVRLVEAYNERGDVYRDWGILLWDAGRKEEADQKFEQALEDYKRSLEGAGEDWPVIRADAYEDTADFCIRTGEPERAEEYLREAEALVPGEYRLVEGQGFREVEGPVEGFWQVMGKVCLARGRIVFAPLRGLEGPLSDEQMTALLDAVEQYALAVAYFLQYSRELRLHQGAFGAIYESLKRYGIPRLEKAREQVSSVAERYAVDLDPLLTTIDGLLGLKAPEVPETVLLPQG